MTYQRSELGNALFNFALAVSKAQAEALRMPRLLKTPDGAVKAKQGFLCDLCGENVHADDLCFADTPDGDVCCTCGEGQQS